jgi:hypothetical protein
MKRKVFYLLALMALTIACWLSATLWLGRQNPANLIVLIAGWLFVLALALAIQRVSAIVWIAAGLLILAGLFLPDSIIAEIFPDLPFASLMAISLCLILSTALVMAALLLYSGLNVSSQYLGVGAGLAPAQAGNRKGLPLLFEKIRLNLYQERQKAGAGDGAGSPAQRKHAGRTAAACFVLSALLIARSLHNLYWFMLWDTTNDPLGYLWLDIPGLAVLFSGVMLLIALPGRARLAGFLYALFIPALMIAVSARAQGIDFRQLTQERAARVSQAIETYHAREGRYPHDLRQLIPWYSLSLPGPVIIYGQDWCYAGGDDYYRLGYVDREHWSDPLLTGRMYTTKGEAPDLPAICAAEIAALEKRYPFFRERR